jgi:hypothetical protein
MHEDPTQDRGPWLETASGNRFWLLDPKPEEVHLWDVATHLSNICRFGGMLDTNEFYSVAQHSVLVSLDVQDPAHALQGLFHDAAEAYCLDIPRPLKRVLTGYKAIETRIAEAVALRLGRPPTWLTTGLPVDVHRSDNRVLLAERRDLRVQSGFQWGIDEEAAQLGVFSRSPLEAFRWFVERAIQLGIPAYEFRRPAVLPAQEGRV